MSSMHVNDLTCDVMSCFNMLNRGLYASRGSCKGTDMGDVRVIKVAGPVEAVSVVCS